MLKEAFEKFMNMFTRIVTAVILVSAVYIYFFWGLSVNLRLSYLFGVLGLSFLLALARLPVEMLENVSRTVALLMRVFYFVFVNVIVVVFGFYLEWFSLENKFMFLCFELVIVISYLAVISMCHFIGKNTADKMNERLKSFSDGE